MKDDDDITKKVLRMGRTQALLGVQMFALAKHLNELPKHEKEKALREIDKKLRK